MRSRQILTSCYNAAEGITSACAEQTKSRKLTKRWTWDHLRVCGADHFYSFRVRMGGRITSACAEQTS